MRRGRPRHDDVLTPREWQVLDLLRDGLTNDQIAARLAISPDTAKFHVSEILTKLGVQTRQQAAAWTGRPRGAPIAGLPGAIARRLASLSPLKLAGAAVIAAAAVTLAALAAGVLLTGSEPGPAGPTFAPDGRTNDEDLNALIEHLLHDDAAALAHRFAGTTARDGFFDFVVYNASDVPSEQWTARLAGRPRTLCAVVTDPPEGYRTPGPGGVPLLMTPRDYDIVLVSDEPQGVDTAWRFSVADGAIIDVFVTPVSGTGPDGMRPHRGLRGLIPSPTDEEGAFAVLPPEETWPAPDYPTRTPGRPSEPPPAGVAEPTYAPDGRTGDPALDQIIEALLTSTAAELQTRFGDKAARQVQRAPDPQRPGNWLTQQVRVAARDWAPRLASAPRTLYAVFTGYSVDVSIVLSVDTGGRDPEAWEFGFIDGRLVDLGIEVPADDPTLPPPLSGVPSVDSEYERYYVLPPRDTLPKPPPSRPLSVRTGDPGVDAILDLLAARDARGLAASAAPAGSVTYRACLDSDKEPSPAEIEQWAAETAAADYRLHAVALVPDGYRPAAEHVIVLLKEVSRFRWEGLGIYERDGRIVGMSPGCSVQGYYLPAKILLPPPPSGQVPPASRRSGIASVDALVDALQAGDEAAISAMIEYGKVPCSTATGVGVPPRCPDGVAPGTPVDALERGCEGSYFVPPSAPARLVTQLGKSGLYAVVERSPPSETKPVVYAITFIESEWSANTLLLTEGRIVRFETFCPAPANPLWQLRGQPDFLLLPP